MAHRQMVEFQTNQKEHLRLVDRFYLIAKGDRLSVERSQPLANVQSASYLLKMYQSRHQSI